MTTPTTTSLEDLVPGLTNKPELKVVTATVISATADIATLRTHDGTDAIMPVTEFYPHRNWVIGESYQLLQTTTTGRVHLSAIRSELIIALLEAISPEVRSGAVRVMGVARSAGERSKVAVASAEAGVVAVPACVGRNANRVTALSKALLGERVDFVSWHPDREIYLRNALAPADVEKIVIDGDRATVTAPTHRMSAAVGGSGLNSQLAGQLTGLSVVVVDNT